LISKRCSIRTEIRLNLCHNPLGLDSPTVEVIEEHGLPDTSQAIEDNALGRPAGYRARPQYFEDFNLAIPAYELDGANSCTGGIGV
jgi:hypothetical protein